jgi:hypothetical protein
MTKITADHLSRGAFVYIRQSTADQLVHNQESQRRQYGLADRAKQLGWVTVEVVDDDLGRSGGGITRPGFERLLAAICEARVGAVFAIEASRLARNGRDWHTLIEFCGLVGTIIVDEDGIYDPRHSNDRLLLGMKGIHPQAFRVMMLAGRMIEIDGERNTKATPIPAPRKGAGDRLWPGAPVRCTAATHRRNRHASWIMPCRPRALPERANPFSRRLAPLSSGEPVRPA